MEWGNLICKPLLESISHQLNLIVPLSVPSHARIVLNMSWVIQIKNFGSRLAAKKNRNVLRRANLGTLVSMVSMSQIMRRNSMDEPPGSVWKTTQWYPQIQAKFGAAQETYNPFAGSTAPRGTRLKKNPTEEPSDAPELLQVIGLWYVFTYIYNYIYMIYPILFYN